jgi:hypothetical protein
MTKWLEAVLAAIPSDFKLERSMGTTTVPADATTLGPLPENILNLLLAYCWMGVSDEATAVAECERQGKGPDLLKSGWVKYQREALGLLIAISIHHEFGVVDRPVGAGLDHDGTLVAYSLPLRMELAILILG